MRIETGMRSGKEIRMIQQVFDNNHTLVVPDKIIQKKFQAKSMLMGLPIKVLTFEEYRKQIERKGEKQC